MGIYRISGVWKDAQDRITHCAVHTKTQEGYTPAEKLTRTAVVSLIEKTINTATTWLWNYKQSDWVNGQTVHVVHGQTGKYLRTSPDKSERDNLDHLINMVWYD